MLMEGQSKKISPSALRKFVFFCVSGNNARLCQHLQGFFKSRRELLQI